MRECTIILLLLLAGFPPSPLHAQKERGGSTYGHVNPDSLHDAWHAVLADDDVTHVYCAWSERKAAGAEVHVAVLIPGQEKALRQMSIAQPDDCEDVRPAAASLGNGEVLVAWQRSLGERRSVMALRLDSLLQERSTQQTIADRMNPGMPAAGSNRRGEALVVWQDFRNGNLDIYAQHINIHGEYADDDFRINDDDGAAMQGPPRVAKDNHDDFLVLWPDNREDGMWKFYYQHIDATRAKKNVLIDSAQRKAMTTLASAVWMTQDTAVFGWKDYREGHSNIYRRVADLSDGGISSAQRLNDDSGSRWQRLVVLDSDGKGNTVACWEDYRNTEINQRGDIYLQPFNRDGNTAGGNIRVNERSDRLARKMPGIAMLSTGAYLVIWHQGEDGAFHLYGQWFQYPAKRLGRNFCITCIE